MTIRTAIDALAADFRAAPLEYTVESALQMRLLALLRKQIGEEIRE